MISMRNARSLWLAAAFLVILGWQVQVFAATSGTDLDSQEDTFIRSDSTGSPGGTSPNTPKEKTLSVGNWGGAYESRALVIFDLTQFTGLTVGSTVSNATLKISYFNNSGSTGTPLTKLRVHRVTRTWKAGDAGINNGASWDRTYTSGDPLWTTAGGDFTGAGILPTVAPTPATNAVIEFDITSIVNEWVNGGQPNYGLIIKSDLDSAAGDWYLINEGPDYASGPAAAQYPKLNVTYTSVTSTTINASQDAGIRSSVNNIGADPQMRLVGATENILLKFPLASIPNNTQVALLRIKTADGGQAGTDIATAYKLSTSAWTEGTGTRAAQTSDGVTWTTTNGTTAWTTAGGDYDNTRGFASPSTTISGSNVDVTFDIDVSALVVEAQAASAASVDFLVIPGAACDWRLGTKEYAGGTPAAPRTAQLIVASSASALPSITVPTPTTTTNGASKTITWTYSGGAMATFDVYLGDGTTFKKISGSPVAGTAGSGTFTFTVDTTGLIAPPASTYVIKIVEATKLFQKTSAAFTINAAAAPLSISTASLTAGTQAVAYTFTMTGTGGTGPYTWTATGVPAGLSLSTGGVLSGTPTVNGSFPIVFTLTDSTPTSVNKTLTLTLAAAPGALAITSGAPPSPVIGVPYSFTVTATGGTAPYTFSATGLPAGLSIAAGTGVISGTPTALGGSSVTVTVTDSVPTSISSPVYTVTVVTAGGGTGKKGGCEVGGFTTDGGAFLFLLVAAGLVTVVIRRQSLAA